MALVIERVVLRPLVGRSPITLFMATLGLAHIIEGAAQALWGAQVHGLELGISDETLEVGGLLLLQFDLFAATTAAALVLLLSLLFNRPRMGLSLCAVADDPRAALTIGIRLPRVWALVWAVAGFVGLVAGLI